MARTLNGMAVIHQYQGRLTEARMFYEEVLLLKLEMGDRSSTAFTLLDVARVLLADGSLEEAIEFPSFVPETMNLLQLFRSFQRQQRGLAIVLDEFGGTAGLVTMEDILEEVIGELRTEGQTESFVFEKLAPGRWRVSGTMPLDDFRREYPELGEVDSAETMGGWLVNHLGVVPPQGESAVLNGLRLTATATDERRVRELLVEVVKRRRDAGK